jgi:hypothetical protein
MLSLFASDAVGLSLFESAGLGRARGAPGGACVAQSEGSGAMLQKLLVGLAVIIALCECLPELQAQESACKVLDAAAARRYLPDRVPMEAEVIAVDMNSVAAIEFVDKSRIAFARLTDAGLSAEMKQKYQYVLVSEARLKLDQLNLPAGMIGMAFALEKAAGAPTRILIARDFSGSEIGRITLHADPNARDESSVGFASKGPKEFELSVGKYVVQGAQR